MTIKSLVNISMWVCLYIERDVYICDGVLSCFYFCMIVLDVCRSCVVCSWLVWIFGDMCELCDMVVWFVWLILCCFVCRAKQLCVFVICRVCLCFVFELSRVLLMICESVDMYVKVVKLCVVWLRVLLCFVVLSCVCVTKCDCCLLARLCVDLFVDGCWVSGRCVYVS